MYVLLLGGTFCIGQEKLVCRVQVLYFLIGLLIILSVIESAVLKSSLIVEPSISPFKSVSVYFLYLGALMSGAYVYNHCIFLVNYSFYHCIMSFFVSCNSFWLRSSCLVLL